MSVTAAKGFVASGVRCGIRSSGLDLALVRSETPASGAAMFTVNRMQAAPVTLSRAHLAAVEPQAVVVNSGNANAATGAQGDKDALATAAATAALLALEPEQVLVLSTGVIGKPLPIERLLRGLDGAAAALAPDGGADAAHAILTTDTHAKQAIAHGPGFTIGGMAKGSGMIHPDLATMLAVVTTDYPLAPGDAAAFLRPAVDESFNAISVDGECSTNDAVVLLANAASSRQIVADGEGATVLAEIDVSGAATHAEAKAIARRVATSPLVKTALFGHDANWGRVLAAAGSAPYNGGYAQLDPQRVTLRFNGATVLAGGAPQTVEADLAGSTCRIELDLGLGDGVASYLTSDLSYEYVRINAEYRT